MNYPINESVPRFGPQPPLRGLMLGPSVRFEPRQRAAPAGGQPSEMTSTWDRNKTVLCISFVRIFVAALVQNDLYVENTYLRRKQRNGVDEKLQSSDNCLLRLLITEHRSDRATSDKWVSK